MRKVKGRLVFSVTSEGQRVPIRNAYLQLWDLDVIDNDYLASGQTDENGYFEFSYNPEAAGRWEDKPDLVLRLLDREYSYDKQGQSISHWHVVKSFDAGEDITDACFDFGELKAAFWEYQTAGLGSVAFTPRVDVIDGKTPQDQRCGRTLEQLQVGAEHFAAYNKHELIAKFSQSSPNNDEIEAYYPVKGSSRELGQQAFSDAFIADLVLNGFNPCVLQKDDKPNSYYVSFKWNGLEIDDRHFAPNTTAYFTLENEALKLEAIGVSKRLGGNTSAHTPYRSEKRYTPADPAWSRVKRLFRINYFLFGEATTHLSETHLNVEQYLIAMRRNLLQNPVAKLLFPHFYGTTAVNLAANDILISADGLIQKTSALTPDSVKYAVKMNFGTLNWYQWKPREPLCESHRYAKLGKLYWEVMENYVEDFFELHESQIRNNWKEIHQMSKDLIAHAEPFVASDENSYYDTNEINTATKPHPLINGIKVALSPVTSSDQASDEDMAKLRQLCQYLLYHVTFKHSWVNDLQYLMGGEIEFASLGVTDDLTNLRVDEHTVIPPAEALELPFVTYVLNYTEYGYILRNEDDDMNPALLRALTARRSDFKALGYDIRSIRSCINT